LVEKRNELKRKVHSKIIPSIIFHIRYNIQEFKKDLTRKLDQKLIKLSEDQEKPLFNVHNTVMCYNLPMKPPKFVIETLALGPRNSVLEKLDKNEILSELDEVIRFCRDKKPQRNINLTKKYLKDT